MKKVFTFLILFTFVMYPLLPAGALTISYYEDIPEKFNKNNIISDFDLQDYNSMSIEQIRDFLTEKGGALAGYIDPRVQMPAYWIIWQVAQEYKMNPKFILTMLQKEQSLVTDTSPSQNQYDWAVGYSCYGGVCLDKFKGFSAQVNAMAGKIMNDYITDLNVKGRHLSNFYCTFTKWCIGHPKETQDYQLIIPENKVTAALYTYNPYQGGTRVDGYKIGANYNFWKIWNNWFEIEKVFRPSGTLLKTASEDTVYLVQNGQKRPFANYSAFITRYKPSDILVVSAKELGQYEEGSVIKFAQYSLLQDSADNIYLLADDSLRKIASSEVFRTLGFNPEEVEEVNDEDLSYLSIGQEITIDSAYPTGALIQDASTGGVYYVESGVKYPLYSKEMIKINYPDQTVISAHPEELEKYPKGEPVKFKDGSLIKSVDGDLVYFISEGKKLPIIDEEAFISRGYDWTKIIETNQKAVDLHPTGQGLEELDLTDILDDEEAVEVEEVALQTN